MSEKLRIFIPIDCKSFNVFHCMYVCEMMNSICIEQPQFFDKNFYCLVYHKVHHHRQNERIQMIYILWIVRGEYRESILLNLLTTRIPFIAFSIVSLIWWLKLTRETGSLLNEICGWNDLIIFLEKKTSWACLFKSGLNEIFHWCAHSAIFCKSLLNFLIIIFLIN